MMGKAARETSLETLGLKGHYYRIMFEPSEFVMILLFAVFKAVRELCFKFYCV